MAWVAQSSTAAFVVTGVVSRATDLKQRTASAVTLATNQSTSQTTSACHVMSPVVVANKVVQDRANPVRLASTSTSSNLKMVQSASNVWDSEK
jgi:hypothetical protein